MLCPKDGVCNNPCMVSVVNIALMDALSYISSINLNAVTQIPSLKSTFAFDHILKSFQSKLVCGLASLGLPSRRLVSRGLNLASAYQN